MKPLSGETSSVMRQLYRCCCNIRQNLVESHIHSKSSLDLQHGVTSGPLEQLNSPIVAGSTCSVTNEEDFEASLAVVNTIIVIAGLYFGQGEEFAHLSGT